MRLVSEQPEEATSEPRSPLHVRECATEKTSGEKAVLANQEIGKDRRKSTGEKNPQAVPDNHADRGEIGRKRQEYPSDPCGKIRK